MLSRPFLAVATLYIGAGNDKDGCLVNVETFLDSGEGFLFVFKRWFERWFETCM